MMNKKQTFPNLNIANNVKMKKIHLLMKKNKKIVKNVKVFF